MPRAPATVHRVLGLLAVGAVAAAAPACKSSSTKDSPQTLERLSDCEHKLSKVDEKDALIETLEAEVARLKIEGGTDQTYTLAIDGDAMVVKARPAGGGTPLDDKVAAQLSQNFLDTVERSRGSIQRCYEQALKKNTRLQARTVSLRVSASFAASGSYSRSSFAPDLGQAFDGCMKAVASKWKLPAAPQSMTFQATVSLSPT